MPDGIVTFRTDLDNAKLEKELEQATRKIESKEKKIAKKTYDRNQIAEQLKAANAEAIEAYNHVERLQKALKESQAITSLTGPSVDPLKYAAELDNQKRIKEELAEQEKILRRKEDAAERLAEKDRRLVGELERETAELNDQKAAAAKIVDQIAQANSVGGRFGDTMSGVTERIDKLSARVSKLASRVFVFSLITTALRSMRTWLGKVIQANNEASDALSKLKGALLTLAQPLINILIPAFTTLVNVLTAVITKIAEFVAVLSGKSLQDYANAAKSLYNETNAIEGVGEAAEEAAGSLAGFDEINQLSGETAASAGGGGSTTDAEPDFFFTDGISDELKEIADLVLLIGAGLALWKIGSLLPGVLGTIATTLGGVLMTVGGLLLLWNGLTDAWENGVDWMNLIEMIGGLAAAAAGLYIALGPVAAGIALVAGGLALLVTGFHDAMENGWNLQNTLLSIAGILATGLGIALIVGSWIPLLIAGIASVLLAFTVATGHGEELLDGIRTILEGFIDFFTGVFSGDIEKAISGIEKIFGGLKTTFEAVINGIKDTFLNFLDWLDEKTGGKFHSIIEEAKGFITAFFDGVNTTVQNAIDGITQIFSGFIEFIAGVFTSDWDMAWEGVKDIFKGVWNGIVSLLEGAVNLIIRGVNWLIRKINDLIGDGLLAAGLEFLGLPNGPIHLIPEANIPRLAQGAVIPPNREFLAVLGDQHSGTNIEAPLSTIKQALLEALQEAGGLGNGGDIHITVELDGKVVARNTVRHINDMTIRAGKPVLLI